MSVEITAQNALSLNQFNDTSFVARATHVTYFSNTFSTLFRSFVNFDRKFDSLSTKILLGSFTLAGHLIQTHTKGKSNIFLDKRTVTKEEEFGGRVEAESDIRSAIKTRRGERGRVGRIAKE